MYYFYIQKAKEAEKEMKIQKKEQEASKKQHDAEMSKMVSLLEEYKIMNQRTVEDKQKEIESILKKTKNQENEQVCYRYLVGEWYPCFLGFFYYW